MTEKSKIELVELDNGLLWPYYNEEKAWSASSLVSILKEIEYGDKQIPEFVLKRAANNGKIFHQIIQKFIQGERKTVNFLDDLTISNFSISEKTQQKLQETIEFLFQNQKLLSIHSFLGSERLHYDFYKGVLVATYTDLEFQDCIVELKSNNIKMMESPLTLLAFQIQLLIQHLCTKKDIHLLWSTGDGVIFHKFQISDKLLKVLDDLIDIVKNKNVYSFQEKRNIVEKIFEDYSPTRLIIN